MANININNSNITADMTFRKLCYMNIQQLTNFPFIEEDFDFITGYQFICQMTEYLNSVIKNSNDQNDSITNLYNAFLDLQNYMNNSVDSLESAFNTLDDYVRNYFANLDVQDEINNKLDEMLEDGVLEQIIEQFLQLTSLICFDNVASMKASVNLANGSYAKTLGYYSINDGGGATYKIRNITNDDVIDNGSIIPLNDEQNLLVAELVPTDFISIYQFGAKGDGTTDDSDFIQNAINYSKSNNYIKIIGETERFSAITKTLKFHAYNQVEDLYLDVKSNSLTNNYMISVNSNNVSTWDLEYPNTTKGYLKNIYLKNSNEISSINGIFNAGNNVYEQIQSDKLNITFYNSGFYLDTVRLFNIQVGRKIGTDYAIHLGYLGDSCELKTAHMYGTIGTNNFITGFAGHNAITLKNIICNGKLYINGGNVSIENIHGESGSQVVIENAITKINNGFFYHNDPNISITNSYVILNQLEFAYYSKTFDYTDSNDIDINITNSSVEINECYKTVKSEDINERITSFVKTNLDEQPTMNPNKKYYKNTYKENYVKCDLKLDSRSVGYSGTSNKVKWRLPSGTYYYKAIPIVDIQRMGRIYYYDNTTSQALTENGNGFTYSVASNGMWRLYRGTSEGVYDSYVDIAICGGSIHDDGIMCNGYKWKSRTAGDIDPFIIIAQDTVQYVENKIRCVRNAIPDGGTWKKGDIIFKQVVGENDPIGWICTSDGTPGTWKAF